jgi:hypothetical protein
VEREAIAAVTMEHHPTGSPSWRPSPPVLALLFSVCGASGGVRREGAGGGGEEGGGEEQEEATRNEGGDGGRKGGGAQR